MVEDTNAENKVNESETSTVSAPVFGVDSQLNNIRKSVQKVSLKHPKKAKPKKVVKKSSSNIKKKSKVSLESIDFSYSKKLKALSNSVKKQKTLDKFDEMEEHMIKSGISMKKTSLEMGALTELFSSFKRKKEPIPKTTKSKSTSSNKSTTKKK